jgi:DNA-binding transcriptional LysR family regulator
MHQQHGRTVADVVASKPHRASGIRRSPRAPCPDGATLAWPMSREHDPSPPALSLAQLRAFVRVAETGSFSLAAVDQAVGQSSISRSILRLERTLGAFLFTRSARGTTLTVAGRAIIGDARRALALIDGLGGQALAASPRGRVTIGGFRSATEQLLPAVMADVRRRHPDIALRVRAIAEIDGAVSRAVGEGSVDIGIGSLPVPGELVVTALFDDPYVRAEPARDPVSELPFILWNEDCSRRAMTWLARDGVPPPPALELDDDRAVLAHIAQGLGYSLMPALSTASAPNGVRTVPVPDGPVRRVAACSTAAALLREEVRTVFEAIKASAGASPGGEV